MPKADLLWKYDILSSFYGFNFRLLSCRYRIFEPKLELNGISSFKEVDRQLLYER